MKTIIRQLNVAVLSFDEEGNVYTDLNDPTPVTDGPALMAALEKWADGVPDFQLAELAKSDHGAPVVPLSSQLSVSMSGEVRFRGEIIGTHTRVGKAVAYLAAQSMMQQFKKKAH